MLVRFNEWQSVKPGIYGIYSYAYVPNQLFAPSSYELVWCMAG